MPRPYPHPLALFSLVPVLENERAKNVIAHPDNSHLVSTMPSGQLGLDVGFHIHGKSSRTLATLGRGVDADIYVEGSSIAKIQCSFERDPDTGVIMFYDRSHGCTSQVFGEPATPFEHGRLLRKIVVAEELNRGIGMGGERRNLVQFHLEWHPGPNPAETIKHYQTLEGDRVENPRLARTIDEVPTELPSRRETRPHTPGLPGLKTRYVIVGDQLGSGHFGTVHKAIDADSGSFMAVKILRRPAGLSKQNEWKQSVYYALKREVEVLSTITHPHIVDYIASQGWDGPKVEIFMGLKAGTLETLVESGADAVAAATCVFFQMLQALDCIAWQGIIHRDVKPENILYTLHPSGQHHFQLGDFGLCNRAVNAATEAGSPLFMAPEIRRGEGQTSKVDVWSLFATILWTLNINGFRHNQFKIRGEAEAAVLLAASEVDRVSHIQEMAIFNPERRASAAQMLVKCFNGEGLSTPRNQLPALPISPSPAIAPARALAPAAPTLTARTTQTKPRGLQKRANVVAAAPLFRVQKARNRLQAQPFRRSPGFAENHGRQR